MLHSLLRFVFFVLLYIALFGCSENGIPTSTPATVSSRPSPTEVTSTETPQVQSTPTPTVLASTQNGVSTSTPETISSRPSPTEVISTETPQVQSTPTPTVLASTSNVENEPAALSLAVDQALIQIYRAQQAPTEINSLEDLIDFVNSIEPGSDQDLGWEEVEEQTTTHINDRDAINVKEQGEAELKLGELLLLRLIRDSQLEFLKVNFDDVPSLERIAVAIHLFRGGFIGQKIKEDEAIALTTPNVTVIVRGTTFLLAYDPDTETTWVGKFEGDLGVEDRYRQENNSLGDLQLMVIPPDDGRENEVWPLHDHVHLTGMTVSDQFELLIKLLDSPLDAAKMISGPYLVIVPSTLRVYSGPGTEYVYLGYIEQGDFFQIQGWSELNSGQWWNIQCPSYLGSKTGCWVGASEQHTQAYNGEYAPELPLPSAPNIITTLPTGSPGISEIRDVYHCTYIGNDQFEWYQYEIFFDANSNPIREEQLDGPFYGAWTPGCPIEPRIWLDGCVVRWDVGSSVTEAYFKYREIDEDGDIMLETSETIVSIPDGSYPYVYSDPNGSFDHTTFSLRIILQNGHTETISFTDGGVWQC